VALRQFGELYLHYIYVQGNVFKIEYKLDRANFVAYNRARRTRVALHRRLKRDRAAGRQNF